MRENKKQSYTRIRVSPQQLVSSGVNRSILSPEQRAKAATLFARFAHLIFPDISAFQDTFAEDMHPDRELAIWEACAETFEQYQRPEGLSDKELARRIVGISMEATRDYPELSAVYRSRLHKHLPGDHGLIVAVPVDSDVVSEAPGRL